MTWLERHLGQRSPQLLATLVAAAIVLPTVGSLIYSVDDWIHQSLGAPGASKTLGEGRFTTWAIRWLFEALGFQDLHAPSLIVPLAVVTYGWAIASIVRRWAGKSHGLLVGTTAMVAAATPYAMELFLWSGATLFLVGSIAVTAFAFDRHDSLRAPRSAAWSLWQPIVLFALALGLYQNALNFGLIIALGQAGATAARREKSPKTIGAGLGKQLGFLGGGVIAWYGASRVLQLLLNHPPSDRFGFVSVGDIDDRLSYAIGIVDDFVLGDERYFAQGTKTVFVVTVLLLLILGWRAPNVGRRIGVLLAVVVLSPALIVGLQLITSTIWMPFRNVSHVGILTALVFLIVAEPVLSRWDTPSAPPEHPVRAGFTLLACCGCLLFVFGAAARINGLFIDQARQGNIDRDLAGEIVDRLTPDELDAVAEVGLSDWTWRGLSKRYSVQLEPIGKLATAPRSAFGTKWATEGLLWERGGISVLASNRAISAADTWCAGRDGFPADDSVVVQDDMLLICTSVSPWRPAPGTIEPGQDP